MKTILMYLQLMLTSSYAGRDRKTVFPFNSTSVRHNLCEEQAKYYLFSVLSYSL